MKKNKNGALIAFIAVLLIAIVFMDIFIVFNMTREQTRTSGSYKLQSVSSALEAAINEANNVTMELAMEAREHLDDRLDLEHFIYRKKNALVENDGAYNVYLAGTGWDLIPDLSDRDGYVGTERPWYTGAIKNSGKPYVSSPYIDALTKDICYTVSVMLGDNDTVLGVDYTLDKIQEYIKMLHSTESADAVIVTDEGIIAGSTDPGFIGQSLISALPDYAAIYSLVKNRTGVVSTKVKDGFLHKNLFATKTGNGWYLIVSENEWELYRGSYIQLGLTVFLSLILFAVIIVLYVLASRSRRRAENALTARDEFLSGISGELKAPLSRIIEISSRANAASDADVESEFARIREAGQSLSEKLGQIISYKSILRTEKSKARSLFPIHKFRINNRFRFLIIAITVIVMMISLYTNIQTTYQLGYTKMKTEADEYKLRLDKWLSEQKSKLDMFCSVFSTNPDMLDDYEGTVEFLNKITKQYPEISASYITNPERVHTVYMNNGWEPDPDQHVEDRPWYISLSKSEEGWIVTTPYYDQPTGGYCVTIAETVRDSLTGEFVGNFGIDFYMDALVNILGDSYSDTGYAFLVDNEGDIINHPYGKYQMTADTRTNISDLPYREAFEDSNTVEFIKDYDSSTKLLYATKSDSTDFSIYIVKSISPIYGSMIVYDLICIAAFIVCIVLIYRTLGNMIRWQDRTNAQMKDAVDAAVAAGKAKNQFLAQMSHEIRTPINAVLGMNEMIIRESKDETIREYAINIKNSGHNLLALINSILDFSKIEDGKMEIIPAKYDLASMINNLVNTIDERAKAKSLRFITDIDPNLPAVLFGDDVRVSQVVMNLLTNAVKYTHEGSVTLTMKDAGRDGDNVSLFVSVKDTGIGIKSEDMKKLFESFERIEEIRNRNIEGTGLGMSVVTKLLGMMNSELHVDSIYGVGSEFSFTVSQQVLSDDRIGNYSDRLKKISEEETGAKKELFAPKARVLIVDDNDMNLKVARNLLKLSQIKPDLASSGAECIELMQSNRYDIVFLDHMMPGMDGIETFHRLRDDKLIPEGTKMIILTANAVVGAKEQYISEGFDDYLSKPIEVEALQEKLAAHLPEGVSEWREEGAASVNTESEKAETAEATKSEAEDTKAVAPATVEAGSRTDSGVPEFGPKDDEVLEFGPTSDDILEFGPTSDDILEFGPSSEESEEEKRLPLSLTPEMKDGLAAAGIDIEEGLRFCGKEESFYIEMLDNYCEGFEAKSKALTEHLSTGNLHDYQILVHSIKSSSKTIGSDSAFTLAKSLEEASGAEDTQFLNAHHDEFIGLYGRLAGSISDILKGKNK